MVTVKNETTFNDLVLIMTGDGPIMGYVNLPYLPGDVESFIMRNPVLVLFLNEPGPEGQQGVSISLQGFMPFPVGRMMDTDALVDIAVSEVKNMVTEMWIDPSLKTAYSNQFSRIQVVPPGTTVPPMDNAKVNPMHIIKK